MTTLCSPWGGQGQRDEYPSRALANFLYSSKFNTKDMDDMLVEECNNRNTVYVLNSSYRYGNLDMIELFGSPAGRALTVNNKTATEMSVGSRRKPAPLPGADDAGSPSAYGQLLATGSISPTNIRISSIDGTIAGRHLIESGDFIRFASEKRPASGTRAPRANGKQGPPHQPDQPSRRNNLKMAKFWKLFDEDRLRKANRAEPAAAEGGADGSAGRRSRWSVGTTTTTTTTTADRTEAVDKFSNDLYSEAAQLLGIKCSLTDSCRCIDCQSQYFDCDDDVDAYSEYSDKSYDLEDNLYPHRSYYQQLSPVASGVPDSDAFGRAGAAAINDHRPTEAQAGCPWDEPDTRDFNGNECQHYSHGSPHERCPTSTGGGEASSAGCSGANETVATDGRTVA